MTTRISERQIVQNMMTLVTKNRLRVDKHSQEVATGYKAANPGDSTFSGTISQLRGVTERITAYESRVKAVESSLTFQENVLSQSTEILIRAKEIAAQGANETNSATERLALAEEVFQMRDHMVSLANSQYQGMYIFHGAAVDTPPFLEDTYATGTGGATQRFVYDDRTPQADGHNLTRDVRVTDEVTVRANTAGTTFESSILALERLGRALQGFRTDEPPAAIGIAGTGAVYAADEFTQQSAAIRAQMDALDVAREQVIQPERVNLAGRLKRLETASSLLELSKISTKEVLSKLQEADMLDAASELAIAETALQASLAATSKVLNLSILNYI